MITPSSPQGDLPQGFVSDANGARWIYIGELTFANASNVYGAALTLPLPQSGEVDLSGMAAVDSSAVAVLVALSRRAVDEGKALAFRNVPAALTALADLYSVEDLLAA
jgi:phospholipid transport system transporter-binding protein